MTTKSEVESWVRPLLAWRADLVLQRDMLFVTPIRHVMRGICFWPGRSRHLPQVLWFMQPLFGVPSPTRGLRLTGDIPVGNSNRDGFQAAMQERVRVAIESFVGFVDTIERLREYAVTPRSLLDGGFSALTLDGYPLDHSVVLCALGRLAEAGSLLRPALELEEQHSRARLKAEEAVLADRPMSRSARRHVDVATDHLAILARLRQLLGRMEAGDRRNLAALLHEWERENVRKWGIEHLWEPTPFPVEEA